MTHQFVTLPSGAGFLGLTHADMKTQHAGLHITIEA